MTTYGIILTLFAIIAEFATNNGLSTHATPFDEKVTKRSDPANHSLTLEETTATKDTVEIWLREYNTEGLQIFHDVAEAEWNYYTDMTESHKENVIQARLRKAAFERTSARTALRYLNNKDLLASTTQRQLDQITKIGVSAIGQRDKFLKVVALDLEEDILYSTSKVKVKDAYSEFSSTENVDKKKELWTDIQNSFSKMKPRFAQQLELTNEAFQNLGYDNLADYWDSMYSGLILSDTAETLWEQIKPLYELLHTYVRHRLRDFYDDEIVLPSTGHIPEHLLGTPGSSDWLGIYDKVKPYSDVADINITHHLHQKIQDVKQLAMKVDTIFSSLGLNVSDQEIWNRSRLSKPKSTNSSCVPKVMNMFDTHVRVQMCGEVDQDTFLSLFDILGEAHLITSYSKQPLPFQSEPFPGFGSAIGGLVSLSALIPSNLKRFDFTDSVSEGYKSDINYLFWMALRILPRLAHDYAVGGWKMATSSGWIHKTNFNSYWWQQRCRSEGIIPAESRSDSNFDAGSYVSTWKLEPFYRIFLSTILQFQLYDSMCYDTGHTETLHKCNLLDETYVHDKIRSMMSLGSSHSWQTVTGEEKLRAQPLLTYFNPLKIWLQGQLSHIDNLTPTNLDTMSKSCSWEISRGFSLKGSTNFFQNFILLLSLYLLFIS